MFKTAGDGADIERAGLAMKGDMARTAAQSVDVVIFIFALLEQTQRGIMPRVIIKRAQSRFPSCNQFTRTWGKSSADLPAAAAPFFSDEINGADCITVAGRCSYSVASIIGNLEPQHS